MKRIILLGVALFSIIAAEAQTARVYRSEFVTYDKREDATVDKRSETARYLDFEPVSIDVMAGEARYMRLRIRLRLPILWSLASCVRV